MHHFLLVFAVACVVCVGLAGGYHDHGFVRVYEFVEEVDHSDEIDGSLGLAMAEQQ